MFYICCFQAALGEGKRGNDIVPLRLKINGKVFIVGSLSGEKFPQVSFNLVLEKEFELSHDWKNGSVHFCGYTAENPYEYPSHSFLFMFEFLRFMFEFLCCQLSLTVITVLTANTYTVPELLRETVYVDFRLVIVRCSLIAVDFESFP